MRSLTPSSAVFPAASGMTYSIPFRSLLDIGDRIRERAAEGAINHEAIARRRHNRRGRGRAVDITREDRLEEIRVLFVGDGMNLGLEILRGFFDTELRLLFSLPALRQPAAFDDSVIVATLENMGIHEAFEPRFFASAVKPRVEGRLRAGNKQRLVALPQVLLPNMGAPHAWVVNQFVFFVFPDSAFHLERRLSGNECPAIAPVRTVIGHVMTVDPHALGRKRYGEEFFELRAVELLVDHLINPRTDLKPL